MNKFLGLITPVALLSIATHAHATVDPQSLIKVTHDNRAECVEFYTYKDSLYCTHEPTSQSSVVDPKIKDYETQTIFFDNRPWQAVWGKKTDEITTVEYIPAGNNLNQWHELVTSQFIPGIQNTITPKQYTDFVLKQLKDSGFQPVVNIIRETPQQVLFEFRIASPENFKQNELQIVNKGNDGLYVVHYVIKEADMGQVNREKWIQNLEKSRFNRH
ncbi:MULTISPECIES: hypothetical protein [Legionella]|uniref:Uncharacterized protein n=1 Tax=Legionella maceachernii TaxID=466 RepID=A0A0W0WDW3_9GAMM|nr:hypothetical protein [Legionella maceachernii]KTD30527.1 hypothetical protein Lmac_0575 [Legionella maceachernii]SJZ65714.1 hypothetical protein SAMN02745128_00677 [Legionella maceachernii]SUP01921.1 Uncharacterised protein [Legionella maceachernii]